MEITPFMREAVKGGSSKGLESVIDVDDLSHWSKRTRSPSGVYDPNKFRFYAAFQTYENYFGVATPLVERAIDQLSLCDTNIPIWFATKDWYYLHSVSCLSGRNPTHQLANAYYNTGV